MNNSVLDEDKFEYWLMDMDGALERFIHTLPPDVSRGLNYSVESLEILEGWLLSKYESVADMKPISEAEQIDGASRYVGETFRRVLSGKWTIDFTDPNNAFYGVPQLVGFKGQKSQLCPQKLVTASVDRRTGKFIMTLLNNHKRNL